MRLMEIGDARLAVWDHGDPTAPALLLLHAGNADSSMWDTIVPALMSDHRVVRYDARGFGASSPVDARYRGNDDAVSVLNALDIEQATLIGASLGGQVALDAALAAPHRVAGVVMIGAGPSGAPFTMTAAEQALSDAIDDAEASEDWATRAELEVDVWSIGPTRRRDQVNPAFLAAATKRAHEQLDLLKSPPGRYSDHEQPPAIERLPELGSPLLTIVGEHDLAAIHSAQRDAAQLAGASGTAIKIADAAHFPSIEQAHAVLSALRPWLDRHHL